MSKSYYDYIIMPFLNIIKSASNPETKNDFKRANTQTTPGFFQLIYRQAQNIVNQHQHEQLKLKKAIGKDKIQKLENLLHSDIIPSFATVDYALENGEYEEVNLMLNYYLIEHDYNNLNNNLLVKAAQRNDIEAMEFLLPYYNDAPAIIKPALKILRNHPENNGLTLENHHALIRAAIDGAELLCKYLIKNGMDVNKKNIQGKTAIYYAMQNYDNAPDTMKNICANLIKNGADLMSCKDFINYKNLKNYFAIDNLAGAILNLNADATNKYYQASILPLAIEHISNMAKKIPNLFKNFTPENYLNYSKELHFNLNDANLIQTELKFLDNNLVPAIKTNDIITNRLLNNTTPFHSSAVKRLNDERSNADVKYARVR